LQEAIDEDDVFAIPVSEAFPEIARAYSRATKEPMDFRTIREDRLPVYRTIDELRRDLHLVFNNCISFNGNDEYGTLASSMLGMLDDIFRDVCREKRVVLK
jgi:hypothetical protein